ncbi:hypothetical protein M0G74_04320 [Microbulbifer sp. CAU 1566]|uniref:hypothetical protein n=1 Tax=Microbulbifer sp. CAU 1566 TaxID=2933269 RepID=UPI002005323F|nr:hypothetical protein [Microbulbifer sp. CAU 1566]MCK7596495.1 hypothetical protein [Microbulbifer sp. CAU 1566]
MENAIRSRATGKKVINGEYETRKVLLKVGTDSVTKYFKERRGMQRRYLTEKAALSRLKGIAGVPELIRSADASHLLEMSRLPGSSVTALNERNLQGLATIVEKMLSAGVARHSLPIRDVLVDAEGNVGLVDFERATLRSRIWRPDWAIAKAVTRYHLYRLISEHQPQLLKPEQWRLVNIGQKLRRAVSFFHAGTHSLRKPA